MFEFGEFLPSAASTLQTADQGIELVSLIPENAKHIMEHDILLVTILDSALLMWNQCPKLLNDPIDQ
jgi:hypothetical protein